jgi:ankyrin repeat protein
LEANADIEAKDDTGQTPMDYALARTINSVYASQETTHILLKAGAVFEQRHWDASPPSFREQYPQYAPSPAT